MCSCNSYNRYGSCSCGSVNPCCTPVNTRDIASTILPQNSWNLPAIAATAELSVPVVKTILVGGFIWNPTYGYFIVTSFNYVTGTLIVENIGLANQSVGTIVPAFTPFMLTDSPFSTAVESGWTGPNPTENGVSWSYASATTITVPSGALNFYSKGDKLRLKQGGSYKYFYIVGVSDTLLTITGGNDYTLTNATITDVGISKVLTPNGFPSVFTYTPVTPEFSVQPVTISGSFYIIGQELTADIIISADGTSNSTSFTATVPVVSGTNTKGVAPLYDAKNNSVSLSSGAIAFISSSQSVVTFYTDQVGAGWTASGNKGGRTVIKYLI